MLAALIAMVTVAPALASDFSRPWLREDRALVIDAYEYNELDWAELVGDRRIAAFINKASDGLPPVYFCSGNETEYRLCKTLWRRHAVARELFHTRRALAKALGLKWGAYHLGRPGNPLEQARNFLDFAEPGPDDLMAIDIEDDDPNQWMSLEDAEIFAVEIKRRTGRYPVLYTNGNTAKTIADNAFRFKVLSRLPLWYARYKAEIGIHFPKGNWDNYALWQFSTQVNCNRRACPYRVKGANLDIDVNVASMSTKELRAAWPFGELVPQKAELVAESVPVPFPRAMALVGEVQMRWAAVAPPPPTLTDRLFAGATDGLSQISNAYAMAASLNAGQAAIGRLLGLGAAETVAPVDPVKTASIEPPAGFGRDRHPVFLLRPVTGESDAYQEMFGGNADARRSDGDRLLGASFPPARRLEAPALPR